LGWVQNGKDARAHEAIFQLLAWAKNSCSMRKKLLQHTPRSENSPRMGKKLLQHAQKWENSPGMGTKIGVSPELLIVEFGGSEDNFL